MAPLFADVDESKADVSVLQLFAKSEPTSRPQRIKRSRSSENVNNISKESQGTIGDADTLLGRAIDEDVEIQTKKSANKKKRKTKHQSEDGEETAIEDAYFQKLLQPSETLETIDKTVTKEGNSETAEEGDFSSSDKHEESDRGSIEIDRSHLSNNGEFVHESLLKNGTEIGKAKRTIFIGNVPSSAILNKPDYNKLKNHFSQYGEIESIRFRSIAFSEMLPRKVAFIQQKLHDKRQSVNAYIVFDSEEGARNALASNGEIVLDHHLRVDSVAHPAKQDTKRSVFIGNLDFECNDEELWAHFDKNVGEVEYVRIIRDSKTNVGKGFAYVQFKDSIYVSKALMLNDKQMNSKGRKLRVMRAKATKTHVSRPTGGISRALKPELKEKLGRARKVLGKVARVKIDTVLEGERAKTGSGTLSGKGALKKRKKPRIRERSTTFKKSGIAKSAKSSEK
ncbi:hypothetical protein V1511DRAFT_502947 [Dipodascopsis uninucleata]